MTHDELAVLRSEVDSLTKVVDELRAEISAARGRVDLTLRGQRRCPVCSGRRVLHFPFVLDKTSYHGDSMSLSAGPKISVVGKPFKEPLGVLEAWLCGACGKVELYAKDAASIEPDGKRVVLVADEEEEDGSPYR